MDKKRFWELVWDTTPIILFMIVMTFGMIMGDIPMVLLGGFLYLGVLMMTLNKFNMESDNLSNKINLRVLELNIRLITQILEKQNKKKGKKKWMTKKKQT